MRNLILLTHHQNDRINVCRHEVVINDGISDKKCKRIRRPIDADEKQNDESGDIIIDEGKILDAKGLILDYD